MSRWERCIVQRGTALTDFLAGYLDSADRSILSVTGGGFDPRSTILTEAISKLQKPKITLLVIREERAASNPEFRDGADKNTEQLKRLVPKNNVAEIQILAKDNAPIGGREIVGLLTKQDFSTITDIILDISALSTGVYFPAAKFLCSVAEHFDSNFHLFVTEEPAIDYGIRGIAHDAPGPLHGFRGRLGLDSTARAVKLWLPQLVPGRRAVLDRLYRRIGPAEVCPILPFPCRDPRLGDILVEEYREELLSTWEVDLRNCVYAAENDPLDIYRTTLRLYDARARIFAETGGSLLILSPTGSKILSVGALLAALERDLPVVLAESVGYEVKNLEAFQQSVDELRSQNLVHVWLHGEPYRAAKKSYPVSQCEAEL